MRDHTRSVANIAKIPDDRQQITVRRRLIWDDAKRAIARPLFTRTAGNFRGRKLSWIDEIQDFAEKTFTDSTVATDWIHRVSHAHNRLL